MPFLVAPLMASSVRSVTQVADVRHKTKAGKSWFKLGRGYETLVDSGK